jgi:hypothetical protein
MVVVVVFSHARAVSGPERSGGFCPIYLECLVEDKNRCRERRVSGNREIA